MSIRTQVYCFVLFLAVLLTSSLVQSQAGQEGPAQTAHSATPDATPFYAAVGEHFHIPGGQVQELVATGLEPAQVVVACFIAQQSLRAPAEIAADRRSGLTWRSIASASGLEPEQFYYPLLFVRQDRVGAVQHDRQAGGGWRWRQLTRPRRCTHVPRHRNHRSPR